MKRFKQSILSDYFVTSPCDGLFHIVGANYDIEDQGNFTLCNHRIDREPGFEVLNNRHLAVRVGGDVKMCSTCRAVLHQRISNMPGQVRIRMFDGEPRQFELPVYQLGLDI